MKKIIIICLTVFLAAGLNAQTASSTDEFDFDLASIEDVSLLDLPGNQSVMIDLTKFTTITTLQLENLNGEVVFKENLENVSNVSFYQLDLELFDNGYYTLVINTNSGTTYRDIEVN